MTRAKPVQNSRTARGDELGLRRALADRILPVLVAAMAFLAALALAGLMAAASLAQHWQEGAGANLTVQVPNPADAAPGGGTRRERALVLLRATPGVAEANSLSDDQLADLLRPWLGNATQTLAVPLPAVIRVRLDAVVQGTDDRAGRAAHLDALARSLTAAVPGTLVESHQIWIGRLSILARSLQAIAAVVVLVVAGVAAAVVAVATRAGLSARREAIEIVHGLGATGGYIAGRFAGRATWLAALGGLAGAALSLPVLLGLAQLAEPFAAAPKSDQVASSMASGPLPVALLAGIAALPFAAAGIGFLTAQATVRGWLRRLP